MKRITSIMGLLAALMLLVSLVPVSASPASAAVTALNFNYTSNPAGSTLRVSNANGVVANAIEATDYAVMSNGSTSYLVDSTTNRLYRATSVGGSWTNITANLATGGFVAGMRLYRVLVAPDDNNIVMVVASEATDTTRNVVLFSSDGGNMWFNTNFPVLPVFPIVAGEEIADIAISTGYPMSGGTARDVAVVTRDVSGAGGAAPLGGHVFVLQLRQYGVGGWVDQLAPAFSYLSVKFAPAYAGDFSMVTIGVNNAGYVGDLTHGATNLLPFGPYLNIGVRQINTNTCRWNAAAITSAPAYPIRIFGATDVAFVDSTTVVSADLALPADFSGQVDRLRRVYACWEDGIAASGVGDVFRIDSARVIHLDLRGRPYSVSYSGSYNAGKLLASQVQDGIAAGKDQNAAVSRSLNPQTASPTWEQAYKPATAGAGLLIGQEARTSVAWLADGKSAVAFSSSQPVAINAPGLWGAGVGLWRAGLPDDESAVSRTLDDSDSWNGITYMDTSIYPVAGFGNAGASDFVVSADETTAYLGTWNWYGAGYSSLWRSTSSGASGLGGAWQRILCMKTNPAPAAPYTSPIIRLAADKADGSVVFWGDAQNGPAFPPPGWATWTAAGLQRSINGGQTWTNTLNQSNIQDFTAPDQNTLHVLSTGGRVAKGTSTGPGWLWAAEVDPLSGPYHMITSMGNTVVLGGGIFAAYSNDAGVTYSRILKSVAPGGNMHVAIDPAYDKNKTIYMTKEGAGASIWRWAIGSSSDWDDLTATPGNVTLDAAACPRFGLVSQESGVVYAATNLVGTPALSVDDGIDRTLDALETLPKPGVFWDTIKAGLPVSTFPAATFRSQPSAISVTGKAPNVHIWGLNSTPLVSGGRDSFQILNFTDTLSQAKPGIGSPKPDAKLGAALIDIAPDGYNVPFGVHWDPVSQSQGYEMQIAKSSDFADLMFFSGGPGAPYLPPIPGAPSSMVQAAGRGVLLGGQEYYARVRVLSVDTRRNNLFLGAMVNQPLRSGWSSTVKLVTKAGNPVTQQSGGAQALAPVNGSTTVPIQGVGFSWTTVPGATEYSFVLATDAALVKTIVSTTVTSPAYAYDGKLTNSTTYFWQVQATKPAPSEKSSTFSFTTVAPAPPPASPPVINVPQPTVIVQAPTTPAPVTTTPAWVWVVIGIGALLVIVTIVLIFRTRRA